MKKLKIMYVFPHPDDESFGPAAAIHRHIKQGHEVYLLTLTKGGATKQRFKFNLSIEQMGEIRYKEMLDVEKTLKLTKMEVLDLPDSGLKEMDPRIIEKVVEKSVSNYKPDIIVSYPVHGISGFHDHIVMHAVIKKVFLDLQEKGNYLKRLAFFTFPDVGGSPYLNNGGFRVKHSTEEEIDCIMDLGEDEIKAIKDSLVCYESYKDAIVESDVLNKIGDKLYFEFFMESFNPPVEDITEKLG